MVAEAKRRWRQGPSLAQRASSPARPSAPPSRRWTWMPPASPTPASGRVPRADPRRAARLRRPGRERRGLSPPPVRRRRRARLRVYRSVSQALRCGIDEIRRLGKLTSLLRNIYIALTLKLNLIYGQFLLRSTRSLAYLCGAITSRGFLFLSNFLLIKDAIYPFLSMFADLGGGVLDSAFVEVCSFILNLNRQENIVQCFDIPRGRQKFYL